ncbi:immunity 53 family protein [Deinococcus aerius]|nr:immunity 53 family protein [Deinococcus aerius]
MLDSPDPLKWLQGWYYAMCDGDWEHGFGPRISCLDNPDWSLEVVLSGTGLDKLSFERVFIERHEHDWIACWVENNSFHGAGGPLNLGELIAVFRAWAEPVLEIKDSPWADMIEGEE